MDRLRRCLVHAGTKETFGLIVLEAMACGRPVVTARAGAFPEFVDEGVGVLAEPNSGTGMADAIASLYERNLDSVGAAARERVLRQFTWNRAFHAQLAAYVSVIGAQRAPATQGHGDIIELRSPTS